MQSSGCLSFSLSFPRNDIDLVVSLLVRIGSSSLYVSLLPVTPGRFRDYETNGIRSPCPVLYTLLEVRFVSSSFPNTWRLLFTTDYPLHRIVPRERAIKRANLSSSPKRGRWIGGVSHRGSRRRQFGRRGVRLEFCARGTGTRNQELVAPAWLVLSPPLHVLGAIHTWYQMRAYVTFGSGVYCPILGKILGRVVVASPFRSPRRNCVKTSPAYTRVCQSDKVSKWQLIEEQGRRELDYR